MGQSKSQGSPASGQHGQRQGQPPSDIDQDRATVEPGSHKPGGDGPGKRAGKSEEQKPSDGDQPRRQP